MFTCYQLKLKVKTSKIIDFDDFWVTENSKNFEGIFERFSSKFKKLKTLKEYPLFLSF